MCPVASGRCPGPRRPSSQCRSVRSPRPFRTSLALMLGTVALGLAVRFAPIGLPGHVVKYGGSMLWACEIYWVMSTLFRNTRIAWITVDAAALSAAIEFFKLYHAPRLDAFRLTIPGVLLLGRIFSWWDISAYWLALAAAALIDVAIRRRQSGVYA
jgi:hypothetical protein